MTKPKCKYTTNYLCVDDDSVDDMALFVTKFLLDLQTIRGKSVQFLVCCVQISISTMHEMSERVSIVHSFHVPLYRAIWRAYVNLVAVLFRLFSFCAYNKAYNVCDSVERVQRSYLLNHCAKSPGTKVFQ